MLMISRPSGYALPDGLHEPMAGRSPTFRTVAAGITGTRPVIAVGTTAVRNWRLLFYAMLTLLVD